MGGIAAAAGKFVIMGDADGSYDFGEIPRFLERLREGNDLVQGCRLPSGGGTVVRRRDAVCCTDGSAIRSSRMMARRWFKSPFHDIYCGMRGFPGAHYERLEQRCTGMEFATEMIIKSCLLGDKTAEVPITLHPDGRKVHAAASEDISRRMANFAIFHALHVRADCSWCPARCSSCSASSPTVWHCRVRRCMESNSTRTPAIRHAGVLCGYRRSSLRFSLRRSRSGRVCCSKIYESGVF